VFRQNQGMQEEKKKKRQKSRKKVTSKVDQGEKKGKGLTHLIYYEKREI